MALLEALKSPAFYVGALGSRVNTAKRKERLGLFDLTPEEVERLKGPIGLFIGAKTPPEIAISILAEITAAKYRVPLLQKRLIPTSELAKLAERLDSLTTHVVAGVSKPGRFRIGLRRCPSGIRRADDPERAGQRHGIADLVPRQRGPDRLCRRCPQLGRLTIQRSARRSDTNGCLNRSGQSQTVGQIERQIDRLEPDGAEPGLLQYGADAALFRKRERPRILWPELRQSRYMAVGFLQGHQKPGVLARLPPASKCEARAGAEAGSHMGERPHRFREEHHTEPRTEQISSTGPERISGCITQREFDRQSLRPALARSLQHRRGHIDAQHMTGRRHALCQSDRRSATSATDVEHDFAHARSSAIQQDVGNRREQRVLLLLSIKPAQAATAVPVGDLVGVGVVRGGRQHYM